MGHYSIYVIRLRTGLAAVVQVACLWLISLAFGRLTAAVHLPVPGSLLGMVCLWLLLQTGLVKERWVAQGADLLLDHLLLFFVPAAAGIVKYGALLHATGWQILVTVATSTALVMAVTGLVAEAGARLAQRRTAAQTPALIADGKNERRGRGA